MPPAYESATGYRTEERIYLCFLLAVDGALRSRFLCAPALVRSFSGQWINVSAEAWHGNVNNVK